MNNESRQIIVIAVFLLSGSGCAHFQTVSTDRLTERPVAAKGHKVVVRANDSNGRAQVGAGEGDCCAEGCVNCSSQIEFGQPNTLVDGVGWFFGIPSKILLWDRRAENHNVSQQTAAVVHEYVQTNGLSDVKVRINQYAPGDEWRRLTQNKAVSPLWRYSFGALSTIGYTLVPGRLFGGDHYNPFTNTVSIYSDIPAIAVHEAAYARDNSKQRFPGTYGFAQQLPGINILHETEATQLAYDWMQSTQRHDLLTESNRVLPPLYGMRVGGSLGELASPGGEVLAIVGAVAGHAVGYGMRQSDDARMAGSEQAEASGKVVPVSYSQTP